MALDPVKFHTNSGGGRQIHSYNGGVDTVATIIASGYFNSITDRLHQGDTINIVGGDGASASNTVAEQIAVLSVTGAAVVTTAKPA